MRHPWVDLDVFMFPPFLLVSRLVGRVRESSRFRAVSGRTPLAREGMVRRLLFLLTQPPLTLPWWYGLLRQSHCFSSARVSTR